MVKRCSFLKHCIQDVETLPYPDWYHGLIGGLCRTKEAPDIIHKYSKEYPNYSFDETQEKIDYFIEAATGASTCYGIQDRCGDDYCKDCLYNGNVNSPMSLGLPNLPSIPVLKKREEAILKPL